MHHRIDVMIAGAQKAGTSSLRRYLAQHPELCTHPQREFTVFVNDAEYDLGYQHVFGTYFGDCGSRKLLAKSAGLMYIPQAISRLYQHNPDLKLIVVLRHPVDRAYSAYWYARRQGWERHETFEDAISNRNYESENWVQRRSVQYLERSNYLPHLKQVCNHFSREQITTILLEEMKERPDQVCRLLFQHIGVNAAYMPDTSQHHNRAARPRSENFARLLSSPSPFKSMLRQLLPNRLTWRMRTSLQRLNETEFTPPPMEQKTRQQLIDYFAPLNAQLGEFLGKELNHWND